MTKLSQENSKVVSFDSENLILVDENDREIGVESKDRCHDGDGILHRAFSLFIFNAKGELLLQQRSADKRLWPLTWSNSCCSHPRAGETMEEATQRRLEQELGLRADVDFLFKFQYQANYKDLGSEHELCWVYAGRSSGDVKANPHEVADWKYINPELLDQQMANDPNQFTPWFKMEWERIRKEFRDWMEPVAA